MANGVEPHHIPASATSDLKNHCLPRSVFPNILGKYGNSGPASCRCLFTVIRINTKNKYKNIYDLKGGYIHLADFSPVSREIIFVTSCLLSCTKIP